mmetsp:Transcript_7631/g.8692  ORF Transcript_7631/g.8692 Transcript_7631/m.8692 type:complete len:105 (+) Transcript_7631:63-377(+)
MARKLARYLSWLGHESCVFNVVQYKADIITKNPEDDKDGFFSNAKVSAEATSEATQDLIEYVNGSGSIAIYDGLNITREERKQFESDITDGIKCEYKLLWVESW